jgi:hypothetical protein
MPGVERLEDRSRRLSGGRSNSLPLEDGTLMRMVPLSRTIIWSPGEPMAKTVSPALKVRFTRESNASPLQGSKRACGAIFQTGTLYFVVGASAT